MITFKTREDLYSQNDLYEDEIKYLYVLYTNCYLRCDEAGLGDDIDDDEMFTWLRSVGVEGDMLAQLDQEKHWYAFRKNSILKIVLQLT